jgi:cell division protein FtsB
MAKKRLIYISIAIAIFMIIFIPGFSKLQELREKNRNLERRIEVLIKTNEELEQEKKKLKDDPGYAEKVAREKLGMAKKNEIILK